MKFLTREENFECFQKKIRELGGDWAREDRVRFTNYQYTKEHCFHGYSEITNLYKNDGTWNWAKHSYIIYVEINNSTQGIKIQFRDYYWQKFKYFYNFKDLKKYLEENNYLQMEITNEHKQGFYY